MKCSDRVNLENPDAQKGRAGVQAEKAAAYAKKGIWLAVLSGITFSIDGTIVAQANHLSPFNRPELLVLMPFICALTHDFTAAILTTLLNLRAGRLKDLGRSIISKPGKFVLLGAVIGSVCGFGGYMAALQMAGPAYVMPITSLYPAVGTLLAVFTLKERISPRGWAGLLLCIAGAVVIGYTPPQGENGELFYLGLAFAVLASIGWGAEGVCATSGMDFIEPVIALNIYYIVSLVIYLCILTPLVSLAILPGNGGMAVLVELAGSPGIFLVALAGGIGACSYLAWYKSMNMTGVSRSMALNITYALWGIVIAAIFTDVEITRNLIIGAIIIFAGMFLVIGHPRDMLDLRKTD